MQFKKILDLGGTSGENNAEENPLREAAESAAARGDAVVAKFRSFWDKHVSVDNAISSKRPESR